MGSALCSLWANPGLSCGQVKSLTWRTVGTSQVIILARLLSGSWDKVTRAAVTPARSECPPALHQRTIDSKVVRLIDLYL